MMRRTAEMKSRFTTGIAMPQHAISGLRFGARSDFGFEKPCRFIDLPASRPEVHTTGFGIGSVEVGSTEKGLGILRLAVPVRVPHNPWS
jgi:hypothetical protein